MNVSVSLESFDPRPRTGGDIIRNAIWSVRNCFDPRPRTGGDLSSFKRQK